MVGLRAPVRALACASAFVLLAGCNAKQASTPAADKTGQVIAKVGPEDVTIHELSNEYRHLGVSADRVTDDVTRAALNEITKRKSLAQRAQAAGLDREPTILLDILRGKEEILAGSLLQRDIQSKVGTIGKSETDRYVNAHPELFSARERFDVDQMSVGLTPTTAQFVDAVKDQSALDAIAAKAAELKQPFSRGAGALFSADLPSELVARMRSRKPEDVFLVRNQNSATFFKVKGQALDPLTGDAAQQRAQALMRNETARAEVAKTGSAEVTYLGTYAKLMETPPPGGAAPAAATPAKAPEPPAK